ncbi:MAG: replication-associated recombination protein A [Nitrospirae bacterium]|nr:replication-associated recombination protein A [Nitrospirota bacterium]
MNVLAGLTTAEDSGSPLAWRMRPRDLDEFVGQTHIIGPGRMLRRAVEADRVSSVILYGPPGCGKTALAHVIAARTQAAFETLNAVTSGVADIRRVVSEAAARKAMSGGKTILFIDEIHRFNKAQQDALLPDVERGTVVMIGASTANPFFSVIPALSSRSAIFELKPLSPGELGTLIDRALSDTERGLGGYNVELSPDAREFIVSRAEGDARRALNALEVGVLTTRPDKDGVIRFGLDVAEESIQKKAVVYEEDEHYDTISAFIKSMRGSDPDAAVYWLAKMLYAGEDPLFIARRVIIAASEDVGNADPGALAVAVAAMQALEHVGMPEGRIPLAQAVTYVATAPKSNAAYKAIGAALKDVEGGAVLPVPDHLKDTSYKGAKRLGRGKGYKYPHDYPGHWVEQEYMAEKRAYYTPSDQGYEKEVKRIQESRVGGKSERP